jgi:hypothetical protein
MSENPELCPVCGSTLNDPEETKSGKKLQRCSRGKWNPETRQTEGCSYVKWLDAPVQTLDEKCPQCGAPLVMQTTRTGKRMKKCSTSGWDRENRVATGCTYIEWLGNETKPLDEECPMCGEKLVEMTTRSGKKMKKCSTAGWNSEFKQPTGCTFVEWL